MKDLDILSTEAEAAEEAARETLIAEGEDAATQHSSTPSPRI